MIKYLDSKRPLVQAISALEDGCRARTAVSHLRNVERLAVCGPRPAVLGALEACRKRALESDASLGRSVAGVGQP